jgi:hypothetical protein
MSTNMSRDGNLYLGDLQIGDRLATQQEVDAFIAANEAAVAASLARVAEKSATVADPFVAAIGAKTRAEVIAYIDSTFPSLTVAQRNVLKALGLTCRLVAKEL